jgi:hypothetical protein
MMTRIEARLRRQPERQTAIVWRTDHLPAVAAGRQLDREQQAQRAQLIDSSLEWAE